MDNKNHEDAIGATVIPARYAGVNRECIDLIRDMMTWWAGDKNHTGKGLRDTFLDGNDAFHLYCVGQVVRYRFRKGLKGPAEEDEAKAAWYERMARHVREPKKYDDPRSERLGFTPYTYTQPSEDELVKVEHLFDDTVLT